MQQLGGGLGFSFTKTCFEGIAVRHGIQAIAKFVITLLTIGPYYMSNFGSESVEYLTK